MRDLTVLRQVADRLDRHSDLRAWVVTEEVDYPSVFVTRQRAKAGDQLWYCDGPAWQCKVFDYGGDSVLAEHRVAAAVITTSIGEEASAAEVADGIEAIYRWMRSAPDDPPVEGGQAR